MSEELNNPKHTEVNIHAPEGVRIEQTSTRGDGSIELGEEFGRDSIDFSNALSHLAIHTEGEVAGSQFNGEVFDSPEAVVDMVTTSLPETLHYDQHGRAEVTLSVEGVVIGYSGVKPLAELEVQAGVRIEKAVRIPGGETAEVDGIEGAWFPEMARNNETGTFEVALNSDGSIKNPHGKFEPEAWIARVDKDAMPGALATDSVTAIIQKNPENGLPTVLTIFPGENAPAFPAKIESENFQADTLQGGSEAVYWASHAFVQTSQ